MNPKNQVVQLMMISVLVGFGLWFSVKWFLGGTSEFTEGLDVRSLGYLREGDTATADAVEARQDSTRDNMSGVPVDLPLALQQASDGQSSTDGDTDPAGEDEDTKAADEQPEEELAEEDEDAEQDDDDVEETDRKVVSLSDEEIEERSRARRQRLAELGLIQEEPPEPTRAIDVSLILPEQCRGSAIARVPVALKFRYESSIIKGESLNALESLVALYRLCEEGEFVLAENPLGRADATQTLTQMRFNEVKYFFIQHRISIDAVQFPEE